MNKLYLINCFECGRLTRPNPETIETMKLLDLNENDFKVRCKRCKAMEYFRLVRMMRGVCYE